MAVAPVPILNQLAAIDAGGAGECFYFSLYGACVFHAENYEALKRGNFNEFPQRFLKALGSAATVKNRNDFNREARMAVANALEHGVLNTADQGVNKFLVLNDPTTEESKAEALKELGPEFMAKFIADVAPATYRDTYNGIMSITAEISRIGTVKDEIQDLIIACRSIVDAINENRPFDIKSLEQQYNIVGSMVASHKFISLRLGTGAEIYAAKILREAPPKIASKLTADITVHEANIKLLVELSKEKTDKLTTLNTTFNIATTKIIQDRAYTQGTFNQDLATIRRTNLRDFANTIDYYIIAELLKDKGIYYNNDITIPIMLDKKVEKIQVGLYIYDPSSNAVIPQITIIKLADGQHYNYYCQNSIYEKFRENAAIKSGLVQLIRQATLAKNPAVPSFDKTLYGIMKYLAIAIADITAMKIYMSNLNKETADAGEWLRFCRDKMPGAQGAIAYYDKYDSNYPVDYRLVGEYISEYRDRLSTFAKRCGLSGPSAITGHSVETVTVAAKTTEAVAPAAPTNKILASAIEKISDTKTSVKEKQTQLKSAASILLAFL